MLFIKFLWCRTLSLLKVILKRATFKSSPLSISYVKFSEEIYFIFIVNVSIFALNFRQFYLPTFLCHIFTAGLEPT